MSTKSYTGSLDFLEQVLSPFNEDTNYPESVGEVMGDYLSILGLSEFDQRKWLLDVLTALRKRVEEVEGQRSSTKMGNKLKNSKLVEIDQFKPMPKRFMVWDKENKTFLTTPMEMWQIVVHFRNRYHQLYDDNGNSRYIFCQSTNFFDKDGNEVFEGSILETKTGIKLYVYSEEGLWKAQTSVTSLNFELFNLDSVYGKYKVIGHVLSHLELLEENDED